MVEKAKVLILGTYHFQKGGDHLIDMETGDVTTDEKQKEIDEVVQNIARYKPNKIATEVKREKEKELNEAYSEYCKGNFNASSKIINHRKEVVQLGFRLGKLLNHNKIYSLDYPINLPEDVFEYAEKNSPKLYADYMKEANEYGISENQIIRNNTVREILRHLNAPDRNDKEHSSFYLRLAQIGAGDTYCGANFLTEWYRRNLCIFANLQSIAKMGDRILVLYGAGHCKILQSLVKDYNEFELIDPLSYL